MPYVGERESGDDCAISSIRRFQRMLQNNMELVETIAIPNWRLNEDDVTIWKRVHLNLAIISTL
jgi:hypothetical protein